MVTWRYSQYDNHNLRGDMKSITDISLLNNPEYLINKLNELSGEHKKSAMMQGLAVLPLRILEVR